MQDTYLRQGVAFIAGKDQQWRPYGPRGEGIWKKLVRKEKVRKETCPRSNMFCCCECEGLAEQSEASDVKGGAHSGYGPVWPLPQCVAMKRQKATN